MGAGSRRCNLAMAFRGRLLKRAAPVPGRHGHRSVAAHAPGLRTRDRSANGDHDTLGDPVSVAISSRRPCASDQQPIRSGPERDRNYGEHHQRVSDRRRDALRPILEFDEPSRFLGPRGDGPFGRASLHPDGERPFAGIAESRSGRFRDRLLGCEVLVRLVAPGHGHPAGRY